MLVIDPPGNPSFNLDNITEQEKQNKNNEVQAYTDFNYGRKRAAHQAKYTFEDGWQNVLKIYHDDIHGW